jgi:hypothetical protein
MILKDILKINYFINFLIFSVIDFFLAFQAKITRKIVLRLECTDCKYRKQLAIKRCKHFELGGEKKRKVRTMANLAFTASVKLFMRSDVGYRMGYFIMGSRILSTGTRDCQFGLMVMSLGKKKK